MRAGSALLSRRASIEDALVATATDVSETETGLQGARDERAGAITVADNTFMSPYLQRPFEHGVDISIQALTKYQAGHADVLMGAILSAADAGQLMFSE